MRIAVFGTGGVGGYFGGKLAQAGEDVVFIARGEHLNAIRRNGLRVDSLLGDFSVQPASATDSPAEAGVVDVVLVATKAWQVAEAAEAMQPLIGPRTAVVPLGNGIEHLDQLEKAVGREHLLGGLTRISAFITGPGHIRHAGIQPYIAFGELDHRPSERAAALHDAFARIPEIKAELPADIHLAMWEKFVFIAAVSGVGAVTRQPMGGYRSVPETRAMLSAALEEVVAVGRAQGVALAPDTAQRILATNIDSAAPGVIASMQKDILEGRPSELEAQTGAVIRLGRAGGVPTPTHAFLYASLLPMELKARGKD
jgi:2-dehydropantoate 2-reductase